MTHTHFVSQQRPNRASIPFDQISWGMVISWMPEYIGGLIEAIINLASGIASRKEVSES